MLNGNKIEFFTFVEGLDTICPPVEAKKCLPSWWSKIKRNEGSCPINNIPTVPGSVKKCPAVSDYILNGFIIKCWTDIYIDPTDTLNPTIQPSMTSMPSINRVMESVYNMHLPDKVLEEYPLTIKIQTPWVVRTKKGYSIKASDPFYHFNLDYVCAPGIVDTDVYHNLSVQLMIKSKKPFCIPFGSPLILLQPFKREKFYMKINKDREMAKKLFSYSSLISFCRFSASSLYNKIRKKII